MEISSETFLIAIASAGLTATVLTVFRRYLSKKHKEETSGLNAQIRELEKQLHLRDRASLDERNQLEVAQAERLKSARNESFEEGRRLGLAESERDHIANITQLKASFSETLAHERDKAAAEARDRLRAEYELQSKLFSVQISPLVRIKEIKEFLSSKYESEVGYQYQLLINGIPAFQPHLVIERSEVRKEVNEENVRELLSIAKQVAEGAIDMYLGANGQFAKIAQPILKRLKG